MTPKRILYLRCPRCDKLYFEANSQRVNTAYDRQHAICPIPPYRERSARLSTDEEIKLVLSDRIHTLLCKKCQR